MDILKVVLAVLGVALLVAVVTLAVIYRRLRHIHVAVDAGFFETLRRVPLSLVIALDLLDLALDVFSAPIIWLILDRLNLKALRQVATIEAIIPISSPIPTMTICWVLARRFPRWRERKPARNARSSGGGPALGSAT